MSGGDLQDSVETMLSAATPWSGDPSEPPPAGADERAVPARIGRYVVLGELGAGGMGIVYAAYDPELDRKVAIKLMYGETDDARARRSAALLRREAQALARLSHPNIVAIHDVGAHAGQVFVTMEFVVGRTLREWREQAPRRWQEVVAVFVQAGRGLMAAHAVGLVHRDVKPDNLLIGDDGRVRVADFGVARFTAPDDDTLSGLGGGGRSLATVVGRGAAIGTPAYMAPEQHDNDGVGPHSDQFSLCVALYEALFGVRPFAGETPAELLEAIHSAPPRRPPGPSQVPLWLDRAVVRGLSPLPDDRWPNLQALLDVLTDDPDERRARRRGRALGVGAAVILAIGLGFGVRALQAAYARAQLEEAAAERLRVVADEVDRLLERGDREDAEAALRAFVAEPEHRESRAVLDAWLLWADRMDAAGDGEASLAALVEAYTALPEGDPREAALFLRIGERFRARWRFPELTVLAAEAARRWPDAVDTPAWAALRADAALARRDFTAHLAEVERGLLAAAREDAAPVVRAVNQLRAPGIAGAAVVPVDLEGDGVLEFATLVDTGVERRLRVHDRSLQPVVELRVDEEFDGGLIGGLPLNEGPGAPSYVVSHRHRPDGEALLFELGRGGLRLAYAWPDDRPQAVAAADLDGDGVREFYVGTGSYTRKLHRLTRGADGAWRREPAHPASDRLASDVNALAVGDFDGDGRDELAVALGPWMAYDVRILEAAADGRLEVGARWRIGHVRGLTALRGADGGALLAIAKDDGAPSKSAFPPDKPGGEPAGLYVVRRVGERLISVYYSPFPGPEVATAVAHPRRLLHGDIDGDGRDDIILAFESAAARRDFATALVWRQLADGGFALAPLGGGFPRFVGDLDDDPAAEILIETELDGASTLAVLGAGGPPPPSIAAPPAVVAPPELADPVLARAWARAEDLAGFGLYAAAAEALERRVALARTRDESRRLQLRAAELYAAGGAPIRAAIALERLAGDGDVDAALRAIAAYESARRFTDALRVADALLEREGLGAAQREAARAARGRALEVALRDDAVELRFDGVLDERWRIREPIGLRVDRVARHLAVDAFADLGELMTMAIDVDGGPLTLEIELDIDRAEWGASLDLVLRHPTGEQVARMGVGASGGGGYHQRISSLTTPETRGSHSLGIRDIDDHGVTTRHALRLRVLPEQRLLDVEERGDHPAEAVFPLVQELRPGRYVLSLMATGVATYGAQLLRARVHRITLVGARPAAAEADEDPRARAARSLVVDDAPRLEADAPPIFRVAAAIERGDLEDARAALGAVDPGEPAERTRLRHLLRVRPALALPLLREVYGPAHAELLREALATAIRMHLDEPVQRLWLAAAAGLDALPTDAPGLRATRAELLRMSAQVWRSLGELDRAAVELGRCVALLDHDAPPRDDGVAELELLRAELDASRGRPGEALDAVERALGRAVDRGWMVERLQMSAALTALHDQPRWRRAIASVR